VKLLTAALSRLPEFQQLLAALEGGRSPAALTGAAAIHRVHAAAAIGLTTQRPVVVICAGESPLYGGIKSPVLPDVVTIEKSTSVSLSPSFSFAYTPISLM